MRGSPGQCKKFAYFFVMLLLVALQPSKSFIPLLRTRSFLTSRRLGSTSKLWEDIQLKANEVRSLKNTGDKHSPQVTQAVQELLQLKAKYAELTGEAGDTETRVKKPSKAVKREENLENHVITPRQIDYSAWYNDILSVSDMVDQSPVRGCMVIKPWGMGVWDLIRQELDYRIRNDAETQNAYFPLFIPKSFF